MESVSSTLSSSQLPQSPFDPYRDHFDPRSDAGHEHPESWSSGGNNSNSPLGQFNNNMEENGDVSMHGMHGGEGSTAHEPKKKRFVCPHCTRTFARSGHLQRHERSRTTLFTR